MSPTRWAAINARAISEWARSKSVLDTSQIQALEQLRAVGIYKTHVGTLIGEAFSVQDLKLRASQLLNSPELKEQILRRRSREGVKWYVIRAFGFKPRRAIPAAFASIALNDRILNIVNSYLGLNSRIIYFDLWHNVAAADGEAALDSEHWHRDGEDRRLVKLFLYLSDVNQTNGPLSYILESQPGARHGALFPHSPPRGSRPLENQLREAVQESGAVSCLGPAGTLVLYDPCGFHRGGRVRNAARTLLVATYGSDAATEAHRYRLEDIATYRNLGMAASYAIRSPVID